MPDYQLNIRNPFEGNPTNPSVGREGAGPVDESKIWHEFVAGSETAVAYIYRNYAKKMYHYSRQFTKSDDLIWDVVQEVFFDLIKNRDRLSVPKSLKAYLFSSTRRKLIKLIEREKKYQLHDDLDEASSFQIHLSSESVLINDQLPEGKRKILESACNQLPARQREAILLMYFEGLTYEEVASVMGMTKIKSARVLMYRAIESLAKHLSALKDKLIIWLVGLMLAHLIS